jgi:hypothetical protein
VSDGAEDRLRDAFAGSGPSDELVASARGRAVDAASAGARTTRRRGRRRTFAVLAVAGALVGGGAATAAVVFDRGDPTVPATAGTRAAIGESGILASAPWLFQAEGGQAIGAVARLPSLRFPPGTTYRAALDALVRSVIADGTLPDGARLARPLPPGVVWKRSRTAPRLDLTAPAGYSRPGGIIRTPSFSIPGWVSTPDAVRIGQALRDGVQIGEDEALLVTITPPRLAACQTLPRRAPCRLAPPRAAARS